MRHIAPRAHHIPIHLFRTGIWPSQVPRGPLRHLRLQHKMHPHGILGEPLHSRLLPQRHKFTGLPRRHSLRQRGRPRAIPPHCRLLTQLQRCRLRRQHRRFLARHHSRQTRDQQDQHHLPPFAHARYRARNLPPGASPALPANRFHSFGADSRKAACAARNPTKRFRNNVCCAVPTANLFFIF